MSDNSTLSELGQEVVSAYPTSIDYNYVQLSAAVIVLYDFLLTLPLEASQIWTGKMNATKALFIMNRYVGILFQYANVFLYFLKPAVDRECLAFDYIQAIASIIVGFAINTIFSLRTFAIYGRNWTVLALVLIPETLLIASNIWLTVIESSVALPRQFQVGPNTCFFNESSSTAYARSVTLHSHLPVSLTILLFLNSGLVGIVSFATFDALVVVLTVCRTARLALQSRKAKIEKSLSFHLLRDGIFYYMVIFLPTFALVALDAVALSAEGQLLPITDDFTIMLDSLQIVMVNRLVLDLSRTVNAREDSEYRTRTGLDPPVFAVNSVLGNIGGPMRTFSASDDDDHIQGIREGNFDSNVDADETDKKLRGIGDPSLEVQHQAGTVEKSVDFATDSLNGLTQFACEIEEIPYNEA